MKKYVNEITKAIMQYRRKQADENRIYDELVSCNRYSKQFLNEKAMESRQTMSNARISMINKLQKNRTELSDYLDKMCDMTTNRINPALMDIRTSGIKLSQDEFVYYAGKYHDFPNSRFIHDLALEQGYTLENIIDKQAVLAKYDRFANMAKISIEPECYLPMLQTEADCLNYEDEFIRETVNPSMKCYETPKTCEEELCHDIARECEKQHHAGLNLADEDDKAFLEGFHTENELKEKVKNNKTDLELAINELTQEQRNDCEALSLLHGNGGVVGQQELDFIKTAK